MIGSKWRVAHDSLGEVKVPRGAYYGAQTARAVENFPISGLRFPRSFIGAQGLLKAAAAAANMKAGLLDEARGQAIIEAAEEVAEGKWDDQFVVDVFQAGAGTSQNMNANEVIANRATEILGGTRGDYTIVHPNDHVNMAQSTNDMIPAAINIAVAKQLEDELLPALGQLIDGLDQKAAEFYPIIKSGRTHLQDAVPIRMGQVFEGYTHTLKDRRAGLLQAQASLMSVGLGGTAVGTGLTSTPEYRTHVLAEAVRRTGLPLKQPDSCFSFMQNLSAPIRVSGALRELAIALIKIAGDLTLLGSGPHGAIGELILPAVQPGSSIMPGKVNPAMSDNLYMICGQVIGNDTAVTVGGLGSQLEINPMTPLIAHNVLSSLAILTNGIRTFTERCILGLKVNRQRTAELLARNLSLVTALNAYIGYDKAAWIAQRCLETGKGLRDCLLEEEILTPDEVDKVLDPEGLV